MGAPAGSVVELLTARFPQWVIASHAYRGDQTVIIRREGLLDVCWFLRDDQAVAFNVLMDLSCVDYLTFGRQQASAPMMRSPSPLPYFMKPKPAGAEAWQRHVDEEFRFEVVYHFYSTIKNHRLRIKVPVAVGDPVVESVTRIWKAADWFEREVWDMFGIRFRGHPNLRRLLMYEEFQGHALRKDYPITKRQPLIGPVDQDPSAPKVPIIVGID